MYGKVNLAVVLVAFACVQIAYSLTCYDCYGVAECKRQITCNQATANNTNYYLSNTHYNVPNTTSPNFNCVHLNYTLNTAVVSIVQGCVYREHNVCDYQQKDASLRKACFVCSGNNCNTKNLAGTYSSSSHSLLGSAVFLLIAKYSLF